MPVSKNFLDDVSPSAIRWADSPESPPREELVELLKVDPDEAVIRSKISILENTRVYLIRKRSTESGIVYRCEPTGKNFILTIKMTTENAHNPRPPRPDPGVYVIDSFMTEEAELKILNDLDDELNGDYQRSMASSQSCSGHTRCEEMAMLQRLVKFTVRSSTSLVSNGLFQFWDKFRQIAGTSTPERVAGFAALKCRAPQGEALDHQALPIPTILQ